MTHSLAGSSKTFLFPLVGRNEREGRKGKERKGKGREGKGREGKGREGKGREGKGREGKGRLKVWIKKEVCFIYIIQGYKWLSCLPLLNRSRLPYCWLT